MASLQQYQEAEKFIPAEAFDASRQEIVGTPTSDNNILVLDQFALDNIVTDDKAGLYQANKFNPGDEILLGANDDNKLGFFSRLLTGRSNKNNADDGYTSEDDDFQAAGDAGLSPLEVAEIAAEGDFDPESNSRRIETEISFKEAAQNFGVRQIGHAVHAVEKLAEFSLAKIGMTEHALKINHARHSDYWYQHASELTRGMKKSPHMPFNALPQPSARKPEAALA